jgi:predicted permease
MARHTGAIPEKDLMKGTAHRPPRWAEKFLIWYCRPELLEDLQGDLNEFFYRHCKSHGLRRAKIIYVIDVLKFLRPYTLIKPKSINLFIHWIMIGSYLKTSGRNIVRNKLFSSINIIGLAISMSVGLLIIAFLSDLLSYDRFHVNKDRIYRVINDYQHLDQEASHMATTSVKAGVRIKNDVSGVEAMARLRNGFNGDVHVGANILPVKALFASEEFFKVFSFQLAGGDARTALKNPNSVVLTQTAAKKLFGDRGALGQTMQFYNERDTSDYVITGVMKDVPKFSHMQFEALVSYATYEILDKDNKRLMHWDNMWMDYIYLLLPEKADLKNLQANLDRISAEENKGLENTKISMSLQPLKDIALGKDLSNQIGPTMMITVVWIVSGLAFVVILSACFNYTNLSLARSMRRSREVSIRKVMGARKGHVLGQFLTESIIISLLSLAFSFCLFLLLRDQFLTITPELTRIVSLELSPKVIVVFIAFAVVVGLAAGFLPALFFSKIDTIQALKDAASMRVFRNVSMRKALIVVQYTFSLMFITATVIGYKQYKHMLSFDLGFNTANILNIDLKGNKPDALEKSLKEMPEVEGISQSIMITSVGTYYGTDMKYKDSMDSAMVYYNAVDERYLPLHGHKLIAGKNFTSKPGNGEESEVIVNEQVLKRFHIAGDPSKALGEIVYVDKKPMEIIGVLKDFHYGKVESQIEPVIFRYSNHEFGFVNVKVKSQDWPATFARIDKAWKEIDPVHPLEAQFYDEQIEKAYGEFSAMLKIVGFLAFLAISIASMGLLGMVVFTTETRLKEISIRKVLGASEGNLIFLLSRNFLLLLCIAAAIALPVTYIFFDKVVLSSIVYHAPISFAELLVSLIIVMGIAFLMIGAQTLKVARSNPAEVLKNE